ncbi:hypothetical protein R3P38DRAFT_2961512 [Favolaschia claudopus]|uniref:Uncharacterized protein n=1 Tax=Favolaschia claudopus TaxID=2862362 RepID=A0AAW0B8Z4_9AGAR
MGRGKHPPVGGTQRSMRTLMWTLLLLLLPQVHQVRRLNNPRLLTRHRMNEVRVDMIQGEFALPFHASGHSIVEGCWGSFRC